MATGKISPEHQEVMERNKGYSPQAFQNPEYRQKIKALDEKVGAAISSGKISEVNSPETVALFDEVFQDKFSASVGTYDEEVGSKISAVNFAGFIPVPKKNEDDEHKVTFALKISYANGAKPKIRPMSEGRTAEAGDPPLQMTPKELFDTLKVKTMMADMTERPEYWQKIGSSVKRSMGVRSTGINNEQNANDAQKAYRRERSSLEKELRKAQQTAMKDMLEGEEKEKFLKPIQDSIDRLDNEYGIKKDDKDKTPQYKSTLEGHNVDSVIERFMKANSNMTKEQALSAAIKQGYISE